MDLEIVCSPLTSSACSRFICFQSVNCQKSSSDFLTSLRPYPWLMLTKGSAWPYLMAAKCPLFQTGCSYLVPSNFVSKSFWLLTYNSKCEIRCPGFLCSMGIEKWSLKSLILSEVMAKQGGMLSTVCAWMHVWMLTPCKPELISGYQDPFHP